MRRRLLSYYLRVDGPQSGSPAVLGYNGLVGYRITAEESQEGVNLTDPEWRALIYVASSHGFSAPHLRLEEGEEEDAELRVEAADVEGLRGALGEALQAREKGEIRTPDGELAYDTIQMVRNFLLSSEGDVRLVRTSG